jgi:putative FmdB family regulatory protein
MDDSAVPQRMQCEDPENYADPNPSVVLEQAQDVELGHDEHQADDYRADSAGAPALKLIFRSHRAHPGILAAVPIYEYKCKKGHVFEVMQRMSDDAITKCEICGAPVERVFHPIAVHFKGSGFYNTDYGTKRRAREKEAASSSSSESSSSSSETKSSDTKSETKKPDAPKASTSPSKD